MHRPGKSLVRAAGAALFTSMTLVGLAACGDSGTASPATTTTTSTGTGTASPTTTTSTSTGTGTASPTTTTTTTTSTGSLIEVSYTGGKVTVSGSKTVAKNAAVTIRITADITDEVHLHSYDLKADVTPTAAGTITFTANRTGIFEVELENKGLTLFELTVK